MPAASTSSPHKAASRGSRRVPSRRYLFAISALATFVVAIILGLGLRPVEPVEAVLRRAGEAAANAAPSAAPNPLEGQRQAELAAWLQQPETLERALRVVQQQEPDVDAGLLKDSLARDMTIAARVGAGAEPSELTISYRGRVAGAARVINEMAEMAIQQEATTIEQPARQRQFQAQQDAESAKRKAVAARKRLEQVASSAAPAAEVATSNKPAAAQPPAVAAMIENPDWRALADQQRRLAERRRQFLEQMTVEHPVIRQLDVDLAQLDTQLSRLPRLIDNPAAKQAAPPAASAAAVAKQSSAAATDAKSAEQARLKKECDAADAQLAAERNKLEAATAELNAILAARLEVASWATAPRWVRGSDAITLAIALLLAWVVGSFVASRTVVVDPTIADEAEAEAVLGLPVVAVLPGGPQSPLEFVPPLSWTPRVARRLSESIVAAALFAIVLLLVADDSFRAGLISEPLSAVPLGVDKLRALMHS